MFSTGLVIKNKSIKVTFLIKKLHYKMTKIATSFHTAMPGQSKQKTFLDKRKYLT